MKEAINLKTKKGWVGVGWVITSPLLVLAIIFMLGTMNPMVSMFMCTIKIVNRSGETVHVTPIGTHIGIKESRDVLDQYAIKMPPIPVFKQGNFILRPNESKIIDYNCDDVRLSEILVRTNDGSYKQISSQNYKVNVIPPISELSNASNAVLDAAKGSEFKWIYWSIICSGLLSLSLYIWYRRLRKTSPDKSPKPPDDASMISEINDQKPRSAKKIKKNIFFSLKGSAVQLLGIILFIICIGLGYSVGDNLGGALGIIIGIILILKLFRIGSKLAVKWYCESCQSVINDENVSICPTCKVRLI